MLKAGVFLGTLPTEDALARHVAAATSIKLKDCIDVESLNEDQYRDWLAEEPRRPVNISRMSREGRRRVLFGSSG